MAERFVLAGDQMNKERRRIITRTSEGRDAHCKACIHRKAGRNPTRSHTRREEPFPWNQLPPELRVKILQNLRRIDLDNCRLLNRETFELIHHNEKSMKRTIIDSVEIPEASAALIFVRNSNLSMKFSFIVEPGSSQGKFPMELWIESQEHYLRVRSFDLVNVPRFKEEFNTMPFYQTPREVRVIPTHKILCCLPQFLKNTEVHQITIEEWYLKEDVLRSFSSCVWYAGCEVHTLTIADVSTDRLTPSMFLQFLRDVAPRKIILRHIMQFMRETINVEILRFIVTRQHFCVEDFEGSWSTPRLIRIDDDVLAQVTALDFKIGAPNLITVDGLKSFIRGLGSKNHDVHGIIHTNFDVPEISLSEFTNVSFHIGKNLRRIEFWFRLDATKSKVLI